MKLLCAALIRGRRYLEGDSYFDVRKINNTKCQNPVELRRLLEGKRLLEGGTYFNMDTQKCGAYQRPGVY